MQGYKIEETIPGNYIVYEQYPMKVLMETQNLWEACIYCCSLRTMFNTSGTTNPNFMYRMVQERN